MSIVSPIFATRVSGDADIKPGFQYDMLAIGSTVDLGSGIPFLKNKVIYIVRVVNAFQDV
jgi:hypothetical protein